MTRTVLTFKQIRNLLVAAVLMIALQPIAARAADAKPIDWDRVTQEATDTLSKYIQINTTNPPGNEIAAANFLKEKLLADGIPATVIESEKGRGIVAARLHGVGKNNKAIVLLSHMDVVPADPKDWKVPPFSGDIKDGEIWGRGALDDKGPGVVELMAILALKRTGILLDRDVLFIATADEEEGGRKGAGWLVDHQPDLFADAGYLLNEGGGIQVEPDGRKVYAVSITEKTPFWIRLTTTGEPGHASAPPDQTSVTRLVHALGKLIDYRPPIKVVGTVENYFRLQGVIDHGPPQYQDLLKSLKDAAFAKRFLAVPSHNAMVRNTVAPTVLAAGQKTNVIPSSATAEVDCRLLPGENPKAFLKVLRELIADDTIKIDELLSFPSVSSPDKSPLMTAIEKLAKTGKSPVVPTMTIGFTDCHYFRQKGIVAYGFIPIEMVEAQEHTVHGANERIPIKSLHDGIVKMAELLEIIGRAGGPAPQ